MEFAQAVIFASILIIGLMGLIWLVMGREDHVHLDLENMDKLLVRLAVEIVLVVGMVAVVFSHDVFFAMGVTATSMVLVHAGCRWYRRRRKRAKSSSA